MSLGKYSDDQLSALEAKMTTAELQDALQKSEHVDQIIRHELAKLEAQAATIGDKINSKKRTLVHSASNLEFLKGAIDRRSS